MLELTEDAKYREPPSQKVSRGFMSSGLLLSLKLVVYGFVWFASLFWCLRHLFSLAGLAGWLAGWLVGWLVGWFACLLLVAGLLGLLALVALLALLRSDRGTGLVKSAFLGCSWVTEVAFEVGMANPPIRRAPLES